MATSFENTAGSHPTGTLPTWGRRVSGAARMAPANLMGRGAAALLPRLERIPTEYRLAEEDSRAILLAKTLTALGIAAPVDWESAQRNASAYVLATLKHWIATHEGAVIRRQFALDCCINSTPDPYSDADTRSNLLYLILNPDSAGCVVIGPTLDLLATINPKLPVTFYRLFVDAVRRWTRVYDFEDARDRLEMWREWLEGEPNPEEYELPDVKGCIPACMKEQPLEVDAVRQLAQEGRNEQITRILTAALDLDVMSQKAQPSDMSEETREAFMDSNPPLPALLVSFKRDDAVEACFDEESQGMMEAEPEPNLILEIVPEDPANVRQAFDALGIFCETMAAASRLMAMLPGSTEAGDGSPRSDR